MNEKKKAPKANKKTKKSRIKLTFQPGGIELDMKNISKEKICQAIKALEYTLHQQSPQMPSSLDELIDAMMKKHNADQK